MDFKDYLNNKEPLEEAKDLSGIKVELTKRLEKDLAFGKKHAKSDPKYWEGAIDVLEDYLKIVKTLK